MGILPMRTVASTSPAEPHGRDAHATGMGPQKFDVAVTVDSFGNFSTPT